MTATGPEPTYCTCPPLGDLLAAYAQGEEVSCQVHRPTARRPVPVLALNNGPALVSRIRSALGPGERFRSDVPDSDPAP